jgi:hypothetical protein
MEELPVGDAYPNARNAVAFHDTPRGQAFWRAMRDGGLSLEDVIGGMLKAASRNYPPFVDEMKTADFRRFVAAKLGMM